MAPVVLCVVARAHQPAQVEVAPLDPAGAAAKTQHSSLVYTAAAHLYGQCGGSVSWPASRSGVPSQNHTDTVILCDVNFDEDLRVVSTTHTLIHLAAHPYYAVSYTSVLSYNSTTL